MSSLLRQLVAISITALVTTPVYAANGIAAEFSQEHIPWMAGSLFLSAVWAVILSVAVFAPVATTADYLVQHRLNLRWFLEPFVVLGVICVFAVPLSVILLGVHPARMASVILTLFFPSLIYYLLLRAIGLREYL